MTKEENFKKSWFKKHPIWTVIIIILVLGIITGFNEEMQNGITSSSTNICNQFINSQIPEQIIFNEDLTLNNTWLDGTRINTLKDYRDVKKDGYLTTVKSGSFNFYKGNKAGQNVNLYYIESKIYESDIAGSSVIAENVFYLEYDKEQGIIADGTILPNKYFKITPNDYTLTFDGNKYYLKINNYKSNCKNIK